MVLIETAAIVDESEYSISPETVIFFIPWISASLPKGTRKTAVASKNEVAIHPNMMADAENSLPMEGRAMLMAELLKGVKKAHTEVTIRMISL